MPGTAPDAIANHFADYDPHVEAYTDAAGTTAAGDTDNVANVPDQLGLRDAVIQATEAERPNLEDDANGWFLLDFASGDTLQAAAFAYGAQPFTVYLVVALDAIAGAQVMMGDGGGGQFTAAAAGGGRFRTRFGSNGDVNVAPVTSISALVYVINGSNSKLWRNGTLLGTFNPGTDAWASGLTVSSASFPAPGLYYRWGFHNANIGDTNAADLATYLYDRYTNPPPSGAEPIEIAGAAGLTTGEDAALVLARRILADSAIASGASGVLAIERRLAGTLSVTAQAQAALIVLRSLMAESGAESTLDASVLAARAIAGTLSGTLEAEAQAAIDRHLAGTLASASGASGALAVVGAIALSGTLSVQGDAEAGLTLRRLLAAQATSEAQLEAAAFLARRVAGTGQGAVGSSANVSRALLLAATAVGTSGLSGVLSQEGAIELSGVVPVQSDQSNALRVARLIGALAGVETGSDALLVRILGETTPAVRPRIAVPPRSPVQEAMPERASTNPATPPRDNRQRAK